MEDMERYMPEERGQTHAAPPPFAPDQFEAQVPQSQNYYWGTSSNADPPFKTPQSRSAPIPSGDRVGHSRSAPIAPDVPSPLANADIESTTTSAAQTWSDAHDTVASLQREHAPASKSIPEKRGEWTWDASTMDPWTQFKQNVNGSGQHTAPLAQVNESFYADSKPGNVYRTVTSSSDGKPKWETSSSAQDDSGVHSSKVEGK